MNEPSKILRAIINLKGGFSWRTIHLSGGHYNDCEDEEEGTDKRWC